MTRSETWVARRAARVERSVCPRGIHRSLRVVVSIIGAIGLNSVSRDNVGRFSCLGDRLIRVLCLL